MVKSTASCYSFFGISWTKRRATDD